MQKIYDLSERTFLFAQKIRSFIKMLPVTISNKQDAMQLIRSSGSIAANYLEACECLSKKDFVMRIKISKKEARESILWLQLIDTNKKTDLETMRVDLIREATELMKILGSIASKSLFRTSNF